MKKALYSIALYTAVIQFSSCSEGPKEVAPNPQNDSVTIEQLDLVAPRILSIGGNDFVETALSAEETKNILIAGSQWMWFATFAKDSDVVIFNKYQASRQAMNGVNEPIGDTLNFSAPDEYVHITQFAPGKRSLSGTESYSFDKKNYKNTIKGNFQITEQHNLMMNAERGHEQNERFSIAVLDKDVMFIEEGVMFEGQTFVVYKRYLRTGELKK